MVEMKGSRSVAQGSRCYEHLGLLMTSVILGHVLKALDAINDSRVWLT